MIIFAVAAIGYVVYKLPPYLTLDPANSRIPPEHALHFAFLSGHVISGSVALLTAVLQFLPWLRRKYPAVHRISGRLYIFVGALPAAVLALAMYPVTPGPGRVAVLFAASLWSIAAIFGWMAARQRRYAAHRRWMVYSFAIMWGYGVWVFVIANLLVEIGVDIPTAVESARWGGWTGNLLIAHWWLERTAGRTIVGVARRSPKAKVAPGAESPALAVGSAPANTGG
ncbi:MAG: DUF2306 domain-containing protein [Actinophytocola sp.]|uniref:DUF2306 domain-containing protein n=1 Tax=Actinophytocola sp. TaxID=1872138 RepID=UPI003C788001